MSSKQQRHYYCYFTVVAAAAALSAGYLSMTCLATFGSMAKQFHHAAKLHHDMEQLQGQVDQQHERIQEIHQSIRHDGTTFNELTTKAAKLERRIEKEETRAVESQQIGEASLENATKTWHQEEKVAMNYTKLALQAELASTWKQVSSNQLAKLSDQDGLAAMECIVHAQQNEDLARGMFVKAQTDLQAAETLRDHEKEESVQGICYWVSTLCDMIRKNPKLDLLEQATNESIQAAREYELMNQLFEQAQTNGTLGKDLYFQSWWKGNASLVLAREANSLRRKSYTNYYRHARKQFQQATQDIANYQKALQEQEKKKKHKRAEIASLQTNVKEYRAKALELDRQARDKEQDATNLQTSALQKEDHIREECSKAKSLFHAARKNRRKVWRLALCTSLVCLGLLGVIGTSIVLRFRQANSSSSPLQWIIRQAPWAVRDWSYLWNHVILFLIAVAYTCELSVDLLMLRLVGRTEIVLGFAGGAGLVQACLLHFIPHMIRMRGDLMIGALQLLVWEDVIKRGLYLFVVFGAELLCWINCGGSFVWLASQAGSHSWPLWILAVSSFSLHLYNFELFPIPNRDYGEQYYSSASSSSRSTGSVRADAPNDTHNDDAETVATESSSLLTSKGSTFTSEQPCTNSLLFDIDLGSAGRRSRQSSDNGSSVQITFDIASTWIHSWSCEIKRLLLLMELLMVSWTLALLRRNIFLLQQLVPMSCCYVLSFSLLLMILLLLTIIIGISTVLYFKWRSRPAVAMMPKGELIFSI
jgi:hypothetical protein